MSQPRGAGYVRINGEPYLVVKDPKSGAFTYTRGTTPKKAVQSLRRLTATGQSNLIEAKFSYKDGIGDESVEDTRDTMHFTSNLYAEREGELIVLPGVLRIDPDTDPSAVVADIQLAWSAPVFVWEQNFLPTDEANISEVQTFFLGDHRAFTFRARTGMSLSLDEDMFFESSTSPTGGTTFNNFAYAAMGGGADTKDRYIRRRDPVTGLWTNDDNNPLTVTAVGNDGAGHARYTTNVAHGYLVGDVVFVVVTTGAVAHAGLWTITKVASTTTFDVSADTSVTTMTGTVNVQDSDVQAEHLVIVGDEMVRTFYTTALGWQTSRVDIVGSNELLVANWTAGIGVLSVGDKSSKPTALVPFGNGELVMKPEGVYQYDVGKALYVNILPELEEHRHPDNGRGSFVYKNWVYIPTVIGLLRWKNGITQDVTPGRGGMSAFDTPIGPIAFITGDATRLYAVVQPFQINQPNNAADLDGVPSESFGYNLTALTPVTLDTTVTDGDRSTYVDLSTLKAAGAMYFGSKFQFHRIHLQIAEFANQVTNGATLTVEIWNGTAWVAKTVYYDGTRGWENTDNDPTSLYQTGDIVFGPLGDGASGNDDWVTTANTYDANLKAGLYWARVRISANVGGVNTTWLEEITFGLHSANALTPLMTSEIANDHGGVVYVLSMQEEQGKGVVWRHMWSLVVPDVTRNSKVYGGPQRVGVCKIVQPGFLRANVTGDRYLFIGMQNLSYLCPLGNHPDPTNQAYQQWYPYSGDGIDNGTRPVVLATPSTDFGLATEVKSLKEIECLSEGIDLSGVEIWYSIDFGPWQFAGMGDDCTPNMPFVFPGGAEPHGTNIAVALAWEADAETPLRLDRFFDLTIRAQPRPEMAETIRMTLELDYDQQMPGAIGRKSPHNRYETLADLQELGVTAEFVNISGDTEWIHVLQVQEHATWNANNKPMLTVDVIAAVGTPQELAT
jgi:hypothetical protein